MGGNGNGRWLSRKRFASIKFQLPTKDDICATPYYVINLYDELYFQLLCIQRPHCEKLQKAGWFHNLLCLLVWKYFPVFVFIKIPDWLPMCRCTWALVNGSTSMYAILIILSTFSLKDELFRNIYIYMFLNTALFFSEKNEYELSQDMVHYFHRF